MNKITRVYEMITEAEALSFKIIKLEDFMESDEFIQIPSLQKQLLYDQYDHMRAYLTALLRRIYYINEGENESIHFMESYVDNDMKVTAQCMEDNEDEV